MLLTLSSMNYEMLEASHSLMTQYVTPCAQGAIDNAFGCLAADARSNSFAQVTLGWVDEPT